MRVPIAPTPSHLPSPLPRIGCHSRGLAANRAATIRRALGAVGLGTFLAFSGGAFVAPPSASARQRASSPTVVAAAGKEGAEPEYEQYDWQRVAESTDSATPAKQKKQQKQIEVEIPQGIDSLPDLPDFDEDDDFVEDDGGAVSGLKTKVSEREILPELPGDPDILPPEPNPIFEVGFGLFEWTGLWIGLLVALGGLGYVGVTAVAKAQMDIEFAQTALTATRIFCTIFQGLFLLRIFLTQFPKMKTTDFPWALAHYPTEWILSPTRAVFKPEAGVDIAPVIWLSIILLASELLTGPSGVLQLAVSNPAGLARIIK